MFLQIYIGSFMPHYVSESTLHEKMRLVGSFAERVNVHHVERKYTTVPVIEPELQV